MNRPEWIPPTGSDPYPRERRPGVALFLFHRVGIVTDRIVPVVIPIHMNFRHIEDLILPRPTDEKSLPLDHLETFGRRAPLHLEIGPGKGRLLARQALTHPENDYLGVELRRPRVEKCAAKALDLGLSNVRLVEGPVEGATGGAEQR